MIRKALLITALAVTVGCSAAARPSAAAAEPALAGEPSLALAQSEPTQALEPAPVDETAVEPSYQPYVSCDVVARRTADGVRIEALAHAGDGVFDTISYDLTVTKDSASGSSDIVQSGAADLAGGETITLGVAEFNVERGGLYRAELVMMDDGGVICRAQLRR